MSIHKRKHAPSLKTALTAPHKLLFKQRSLELKLKEVEEDHFTKELAKRITPIVQMN